MPEGGLKREYVHAPLHSVCGMAVPQLVWVNVKTGGSSPLSANISNRLSSEMSLATGARKYIAVSFAAAKRVKKLEVVGDDFALEVVQQRHLQRNEVARCVGKTAVINH